MLHICILKASLSMQMYFNFSKQFTYIQQFVALRSNLTTRIHIDMHV